MTRWALGWGAAVVVVAIAAGLLVTIIALCRRIVAQAGEITKALDGARDNTDALFDIADTKASLERITADLRNVREGLERQ